MHGKTTLRNAVPVNSIFFICFLTVRKILLPRVTFIPEPFLLFIYMLQRDNVTNANCLSFDETFFLSKMVQ